MIKHFHRTTTVSGRPDRTGTLLVSTALVSCLAGLASGAPASAQSVTTSGDVDPSPATSPVWNVGGPLEIGDFGNGMMTVADGGSVSNQNGEIGSSAGSTGTATVTGTGSTWTNSSGLFVGYGGSGTLIVEDGGAVSNDSGHIGYFHNSTGTVTVTGDGSTWTNSGDLRVGSEGAGTLSVEDGGAVSNDDGYIGTISGSGMATVTGAGSTWTNSGELFVGNGDTGALTIENGGAVSNTIGTIGRFSNSTGTATVTGASTTWTNSGSLIVGNTGDGTLSVEDGAAVRNQYGYIGTGAGSTGTATVTGVDSTWTNSNGLIVGNAGAGTLSVEDGGAVSSQYGYIGAYAGSTGTATVTDDDSSWVNNGVLDVGYNGNGTLRVEGGGAVSNAAGYIGTSSGSIGTATVTGDGSTWINGSNLFVGNDGVGTLNVEAGGLVSNTEGYIGANTGSTGSVTVTGDGSTWTSSGNLFIGGTGTGTMTIADGGAVVTGNQGVTGYSAGSAGTVTVTGPASVWTLNGALQVGREGTGELVIADGGSVSLDPTSSTANYLTIGSRQGSSGVMTVTGDGSAWNGRDGIFVGDRGTGLLTIEDGGAVSDGLGIIGGAAGGAGTAIVRGAGSTWTSSGLFYVGLSGAGTLSVEDGGTVSTTTGVIGEAPGSTGTAMITGDGSTWINSANFVVGNAGSGTLTISDGGAVSNTNASISNNPGSTGTATVTGDGSTWTNRGTLSVGLIGNGKLTIENGGLVSNTVGFIGRNSGSTGTVTVTGDGSTWTNSNLFVGDNGNGTLMITDGGAVSSSNGYIGANPDPTSTGIGTATVSGAGSTWTSSGILAIGFAGDGTLTIEGGGTVSNTNGFIGYVSDSTSEVTVTGTGSTWTNSGDLSVGVLGNGTLTVENGGLVSDTIGYIGTNAGSTGTVMVTDDGSTWTSSDDLYVGNDGAGTLTVQDGGLVSNADGLIGHSSGSTGTVTVTGADSAWTNSEGIYVGVEGTGTLNITDGAMVSTWVTGATGVEGSAIGGEEGGSGAVTVTGDGSTWTNGALLLVGNIGNGTLTVADGGAVSNVEAAIGYQSDGTGAVTVTGAGSTWTNSKRLYVGYIGNGTLTIADGGAVSNTDGTIGYSSGDGAVTVTGAGSTWTNSGVLSVGGDNSRGVLTVSDGGVVSAPQIMIAAVPRIDGRVNTGTVNIGSAVGDTAVAAGTLDADEVVFGGAAGGVGTLNFNHTNADYAFAPAIMGEGAINVASGTTRLVADSSGFTGPTSIAGGVLLVDGSFGDGASTVAVTGGGGLGGMGTIGGAVTVADGSLIGVQGQTLSMNSLALGAGSTVEVTLGAPGDTGLFDVAGNLTLDGTLDVTDGTGFGPGIYRLFDYGGDLTDLGLEIGMTPAGVAAADLSIQTSMDQQVNLVNVAGAELLFWDGGDAGGHNNGSIEGGDGVWDAVYSNWTDQNGALNGAMRPSPGFAVFQGAMGSVVVDDSSGPISATGMQFAVDGYVVGGSSIELAGADGESVIRVGDGSAAGAGYTATIISSLTGAGSLVKTDLGTLILSGANSYQGGTRVTGGVLEVSADANLGAASGDLTLDGGALRNTASFTTARGITLNAGGGTFLTDGALTASGSISGAGGLTKDGAGRLILSGTNGYSGGTTILQGSLVAAVTGALGTGPVAIDGGELVFVDSASAGDLTIDNKTFLAFRQTSSAGAATITATGGINFYNTSSAQDATIVSGGQGMSFNGASSAGNATITNDSRLNFYDTATASAATITNTGDLSTIGFHGSNTADNATIVNAAGVLEISELTAAGIGIGSLSGGGAVYLGSKTLTLGALAQDDVIGGVIQDRGGSTGGSLVKTGAGTLTLTGVNTYTGTTTVGGGTLSIGDGGAAGSIVGDAVIAAAGTLAFDRGDNLGYSGAVSGSGAFIKDGGGMLTLTGDSSAFTGDSAVAAGTLRVDGMLGGTLEVRDGATLAGAGTVGGAVAVASGGTLTGVQGQTLSLGSLALDSGATIAVTLGAPGNTALFDVAGDLTLDGTLDVTDAGGFGAGVYRLIDYGGDLTDNGLAIGVTPGGMPASDLIVQTAVDQQVNLVSLSGVDLLFWDGGNASLHNNSAVDGGAGVWDAASANWTNASGAGNGPMRPVPGFAVFQAAAGTVTVDDGAGVVRAAGMQFASDGYVIAGDAIELAGAEGQTIVRVGDGTAAGADYTATIASSLTGVSDLVKNDLGTLILTGANSYQGDTVVAAGTLIGDTAAIRGNIANAGTAVFDQADDASFAGDIAALGGTAGVMVKRGAGELTLAGASALDWTVEAGGLTSAADRFTGDVSIGADTAFTFNQSDAPAYAGAISGSGAFIKSGEGVLSLTGDSSAFTGGTDVTMGTLLVNGTLGGTLDVRGGATIGGSGTVGTTVVASGGKVAPGNSIGTLTVAGNITFAAGSIYEVEVDPTGTDSDLVAASGTAFLDGGSVVHIGADGTYDPTSTYTILTAGGGIDGTFDAVSSDFAFLDAILDYGANAITLTLERNDISFAEIGVTRNQIATATGVESLAFGVPVYDAVVPLDEETARFAFDQLSGEIHGSAKTALIEDSRFVREAAMGRVRAAFDGIGSATGPVLAYNDGGPASAGVGGFVGWGHAFGSWGEIDSDGNAAVLDHASRGFFMGVDGLTRGGWRIGLMGGYSRSTFDADDRASSGESDNYHLGIYGGTQQGAFGVRLGAAYTFHNIHTDRSIAFAGFADSTSASYEAGTGQVFGEAGYRIDLGASSFEPFAGLAYVNHSNSVFVENGGAAALMGKKETTEVGFSTLGLRAASGFALGDMAVKARGTLGWRHAFGDAVPLSTHRFAGGDAFTIAGLPIDEDAAVVEAGLDLGLSDTATLGAYYSGQIANDAKQHGFKANFSLKF